MASKIGGVASLANENAWWRRLLRRGGELKWCPNYSRYLSCLAPVIIGARRHCTRRRKPCANRMLVGAKPMTRNERAGGGGLVVGRRNRSGQSSAGVSIIVLLVLADT